MWVFPGASRRACVSTALRAKPKSSFAALALRCGPGCDYSQRMPGSAGALADWQSWHRQREAKPSPESLRGRAVVGTEWALKEGYWSPNLMERAFQRYRTERTKPSRALALLSACFNLCINTSSSAGVFIIMLLMISFSIYQCLISLDSCSF